VCSSDLSREVPSEKEPTAVSTSTGNVPEEEYTIPFGEADIKRKGGDVVIIETLLMVHKALRAAEILSDQSIDVEVIDPRSFVPLDKQTILSSVKKTGRVVIVDEGCKTCGLGAELSAIISEEAFDYLDAPVERVTAMDTPIPFSPILESMVIPDEQRIIEAVKKTISIN
jgi:pyruvate/2-oxoglutarate/acetoin dehydrogenase E1 component